MTPNHAQGAPSLLAQVSTRSFADYAERVRPRIESALDRYTRLAPDCPPPLREAIRYSLLAPAKRLRPLLALMAAETCGSNGEAAMPAACAIEMIHTYSLIHDDLPAMDDDDLRRGRPTNHKVHGEALAILAGDALLTMAFEIVARDTRPAELAARCCAELASAAGPLALVGGQAADLAAEAAGWDFGQDSSERALESIHRRKTGAMISVSLKLGALAAGADGAALEALEQYGRRLGLAFQIMDDLLDVRGHEATVGKRVGKDADRGKLTFPALLGIEESERRAAELVAEARLALEPFDTAADELVSLAQYVMERDR